MKKVLISIMLLVSFVIFTGCDQTEVNDMDYDELDFTNEAIECTVKEVCIMNENGSNEDAFHCIADSEDPLRTDGMIYELEGVTSDFKKKYHNQKKSITEKVRAKFGRIAKSSRFSKRIQNAMAREIRRSEVRLNVSNFRLSKNKLELTNESTWSLTEDAGNIENAESFDSDAARANLEENASGTDETIVLVILVTANDSEPTSSPATISDTVFGTNGKSLNMASQFATCSFDMKTIFPADGPHIVDGVLQVAIDQNVLGTDGGRIFRNAAIAAANEKLGFSVKSQFDNVMIVCPPGIKSGWAGYAYVNGNLSVYKDNFINNIHVIMHEVGHNFGLLHSGEGSLNYGDHTGYMGTAYGKEYCFNGAKSSELGWYSDREYVISDSWTGNLVGVVDYAKALGDEQVLLKVKGATEDDIHIAFNRKKGFNKGTMEAGDQITVTKRSSKPGSAQSWLLAKLDKGADYKVNDFGGSNNHLYIKVDDIVYGSNVDYATVSVNFGQELVAVTVNNGTGSGNYATGTTVTITANTAPKGQEFDKWVVNSGGAVIANTNESSTPLKLGASDATVTATYKAVLNKTKAERGVITAVSSSSWTTVNLNKSYSSMVVVATPNYSNTSNPAVVRIQNASGSSFQVKMSMASSGPVSKIKVHYLVIEEGVYDSPKMEAKRVLSDGINLKNSWSSSSMEAYNYANSYTRPVVLGQVMTHNDPGFSVFWASNGSQNNPPSASACYVGKHIAEDKNTTRANETLGVVVIESGSGVFDGISYTAGLGSDSVGGVGTSPSYPYSISGVSNPGTAILSSVGMDGSDGGWPILYGSNPVTATTINTAIDEDTFSDSERNHTTEQLAYIVLDQ